MALVSVGGAWTALARAVAVGVVLLAQGFPRPKAAFNVTVAVIEVCAAVAVVEALPVGDISDPATWFTFVVAILAGSLLGAMLIAGAIIATQGFPAGRCGRRSWYRSSWSARSPWPSGWRCSCSSASPPGRGC